MYVDTISSMYHHDCGPTHWPHPPPLPSFAIFIHSCSHGDFTAIVDLHEGRHEYKFFVDGQWLHDPNEVYTPCSGFKKPICVKL